MTYVVNRDFVIKTNDHRIEVVKLELAPKLSEMLDQFISSLTLGCGYRSRCHMHVSLNILINNLFQIEIFFSGLKDKIVHHATCLNNFTSEFRSKVQEVQAAKALLENTIATLNQPSHPLVVDIE